MSLTKPLFALLNALLLTAGSVVHANDSSVDLKLSVGVSSQSSNEVQIPNNTQSTRFSLEDFTGSAPLPAIRLEGIWNINNKHAVRVLLAPLSYSETGEINQPIRFAGESFNTDSPVTGEYRFNSWRVGYRYHLRDRSNWDLWLGGTLKVRDAEIKLIQGATSSSDDDLGLVPLLHLAGEYRLGGNWLLAADIDALAGGPGRAIDLGLSANYKIGTNWTVGAEYRLLEGGADTDTVYNFALFNSLLTTVQYRPAR